MVSAVLSQGTLVLAMAMVMDMVLEESALELVFTQLDQSTSPGQPRVLARGVLMLSQGTLVLAMVMVMALLLTAMLSEVSALELVFTPLDQSMSPDQPRVLARGVLMLSHGTLVLAMVMVMD